MKLRIGQKVRFLKGTEEGVISKIVNDNIIEVEIEDGFNIPVLKKEVVVIAKEEDSFFQNTEEEEPEVALQKSNLPVNNTKGIFLAFSEINDQELSLHFINNTSHQLLFSFSKIQHEEQEGIAAGLIEKQDVKKIGALSRSDFDSWSNINIQILFFKTGIFDLKEPFNKRLKLKASSIFKKKTTAPILGKSAYLYQIDISDKKNVLDPQKLKESLYESKEIEDNYVQESQKTVNTLIDLHIDKILKEYNHLSNSEILELQISTLEKSLNNAISAGIDEFTIIHGIGEGILKNSIHKILRETPNIKFAENHNLEKFGKGATLVRIQ